MTQDKFKRLKVGAKVRFNSKYMRFCLDNAPSLNLDGDLYFNYEGALCDVLISIGAYQAVLSGPINPNKARLVTIVFPKFSGLTTTFWTDQRELV